MILVWAGSNSRRGTPGICPNQRPIGSMDSAWIKPHLTACKLPPSFWCFWGMPNACFPSALRPSSAGKYVPGRRITITLTAPSPIGGELGAESQAGVGSLMARRAIFLRAELGVFGETCWDFRAYTPMGGGSKGISGKHAGT